MRKCQQGKDPWREVREHYGQGIECKSPDEAASWIFDTEAFSLRQIRAPLLPGTGLRGVEAEPGLSNFSGDTSPANAVVGSMSGRPIPYERSDTCRSWSSIYVKDISRV